MATTAPQPADPPPPAALVGIASLVWGSLSLALMFYALGVGIGASYELTTGPAPAVMLGPVVLVSSLLPVVSGIAWLVLAPRVPFLLRHWRTLAMLVAVLSLLQLTWLADPLAAVPVGLMHLSVGAVVGFGTPRLVPLDETA